MVGLMMEIGENEFYIMNEFERFTHIMPKFFFEMEGNYVFLIEGRFPQPKIMEGSRREPERDAGNREQQFTSYAPAGAFKAQQLFGFPRQVAELGKRLNKNIVVVLDSSDPETFIRNLFKNVNLLNINIDPAQKQVHVNVAERDRSLAIGRGGYRIKVGKKLLKDKFGYDLMLHYTMI